MTVDRRAWRMREAAVRDERGSTPLLSWPVSMDTPDESRETKPQAEPTEVTRLLVEYAGGDRSAFDRLLPLVYEDLRRIARRRLRQERPGHTLSTTALVHEAYLGLVDQATASWRDRAHFFAFASRVIRNILTDYARRRGAAKRGGGAVHVALQEDAAGNEPPVVELLALDEALAALAEKDPRLEQIVECRFFGGMSVKETAEALGLSLRTVERDWTRAKAYLYQALKGD